MLIKSIAAVSISLLLSGCLTTGVGVGKGDTGPVSGTASSHGSQGSAQLARCSVPRSTVILDLAQGQNEQIFTLYKLPPDPLPAMRLIAQQTGCFRIAHRSRLLKEERELQRSGETSSNVLQKGQVAPADHLLLVEVILSNPDASGTSALGALGGLFGTGGLIIGSIAGSIRTSEASVVLTLVDARTGLQTASVTGNASGTSFGIGGALGLGTGGFASLGGAGGYENTAQGKVVMGAMLDAMNKLEPLIPQKLDAAFAPPLTSSSVNQTKETSDGKTNLVRAIQFQLLEKGYDVAVDGIYGPQTKAAIVSYQQANGLPADGLASESLLENLKNQ